jgi:FtsP/CotA-like multicopper oxidase with cupredoxin domain
MLSFMRRFLALLCLVASTACGSSEEDTSRAPPPSREGDAGAAPRGQRPLAQIWGAPTLVDENPDPNIVEVRLRAGRARAVVGEKEIDVLAYNGMVPGPILQARPRQRVIVHFENGLDEPTTIHWHGLRIPDTMDGSPRIQSPVPAGKSFTYDFVVPEAGSYWYHPHVATHDQLERGLHGAIVIQDDLDPIYDVERFLVLDDVLLDSAGNISPTRLDGLTGMTGRYGNTLLTNGRMAKNATATAKKGNVERWRLLNTANARRMRVHVEGARARLIGTDGGLLPKPMDLVEASDVTLAVGARLDLEVSYDAAGSAKLVLSDAEGPQTMFAVAVADSPDAPRAIPWPNVKPAIAERPPKARLDLSFDFAQESGGAGKWLINGQSHWMEPLTSLPQGSTVLIRLSNASGGIAHPFHMHGQFFRIVGDPSSPGLRDTVMVPEHGPVEIITYFDNPGLWMAHCHILEHVELGMMAEIEVTKTGAPVPGATSAHSH